MAKYIVKILAVEDVTHNVKRFLLEKLAGYSLIPGQATELSINRPGLTTELRPFTFTSLNEWDYLEFTIKIYKGHGGITEQLAGLQTGDELIIHEAFGTIPYKGPGVFIAGGAGITPFLAILRQLRQEKNLTGNILLFANHNETDIIHRMELKVMLGDNYIDVLKARRNPNVAGRLIDESS